MGQINLSDYKNIYMQTAREYVNKIISAYSKLSVNPQDKEAAIEIHLSLHSLKGQSQIMGFTNIINACESTEEAVENILKGTRKIGDDFLTLLKRSVDKINSELGLIEKGNVA